LDLVGLGLQNFRTVWAMVDLDWPLKFQDWIWIVNNDSPLISAANPHEVMIMSSDERLCDTLLALLEN